MKLTFIAFCIQFEGFVFWLSAHLFQLLGAETHVCLKAGQKLPFGEAETQLLHKSCILGEGVNAQDNYGPLEVHKKKKVQCVFEWYPLGSAENYQITLDKWLQFSRGPHSSHLISLLYPEALKLNASHLFSALPSPCCYKSLRGKSSVNLLPLLLLSSSSSTRTDLYFF